MPATFLSLALAVYDVVKQLAQPFPWLIIVVGFGMWGAWRRVPERRGWWRLAWAVYALLVIDCLPITGHYMSGLLEWQYEERIARPSDTRAIVVLGGSAYWVNDGKRRGRLASNSVHRSQRAAELYHEGPRCPIVVSGGGATRDVAAVGTLMGEFLIVAGVDPADVIVEDRSRNTEENARFTAEILRERGLTDGIVLVTTATHLPRSVALFRREGFDVIPVGCAYRTHETERGVWQFWPRPHPAGVNQEVVHEVLGMAKAWLRGNL